MNRAPFVTTSVLALLCVILAGCSTAGIQAYRRDTDEKYRIGAQALRNHETHAAISILSECLERDPVHPGCLYEMGWAQLHSWNWSDAVAVWSTLKRVKPDYPELNAALAKAQAHLKIMTEARVLKTNAPSRIRAPRKRAFLHLRAVGDMMLGSDFPKPVFPPEGMQILQPVTALLKEADLRFGNLEGNLCDGGKTEKCGANENCYAFRSPTRFGTQFKDAGFDVLSLANNHVADFGDECMAQTRATLDQLGIRWSGPPGTFAELEKNGRKIALIAFHTADHVNNVNDLPEARKMVRELRKKNHLVIVSFHGGAEGFAALHVPGKKEIFFGEDRGDVREFARAMIDAGASLVIGHGPHVTRAMEIYKGHLIAYSLGNFATYGKFNLLGFNSVGLVLDVELDAKGLFKTGHILPIRQTGWGLPQPDPRETSIDLIRYLSVSDFPETAVGISRDGTIYNPYLKKTRHRLRKRAGTE